MLNYIWSARKSLTGGGATAAWIWVLENNPFAFAGAGWEWKAAFGCLVVGVCIWIQPNMSKKERERFKAFLR